MTDQELTRWQVLEKWLAGGREQFTIRELAGSMGITPVEATGMTQAYLRAQRAVSIDTAYVLKREGRTRAAVWSVGQKTVDARMIGGILFDDVAVKVNRAFKPDLDQLASINPHAARYAQAKIEAVMDGALKVLASALDVPV